MDHPLKKKKEKERERRFDARILISKREWGDRLENWYYWNLIDFQIF